MGDLVNLRQVRKQKQRDEKSRKADQNRALHGRTRDERSLTEQERKSADKKHDGHKRVDAGKGDPVPETPTGEDAAPTEGTENNVVSIFSPDRCSD